MGKIVAVANQKGGVGKTTTAVNLSSCVAALGKKVLVADIDPQGNTTGGLGVDADKLNGTVYDVLVNGVNIKEAISPAPYFSMHILGSDISLAGAEIELVSVEKREFLLKQALESVRDEYDFIFIDCPPSLGLITLNGLVAADTVLVPIQCEYYALEGLSQLMNTVRLVRMNLNPVLDVEGVVMTMYDKRTNLSGQVVGEVKKFFRNKVYETIIPRSVRLGEAPSFGLPITLYDAKCNAAKAYISLAEELIECDNE